MNSAKTIFWIQLKNKDKKAFSAFFNTMYPKLFSVAIKATNDKEISLNLIQETYISFWNKLENIQAKKESMEAYLIQILKNKIIDYYRKYKPHTIPLENINIETELIIEDSYQEYLENNEVIQKTLNQAINNLSQQTKDIFILSKISGYTYAEIAEEKNISIKTVEAHISKALKLLRNQLKKN